MIVIQCHQFVGEEERRKMQKTFLRESNEGVVVLPAYCSLAGVSADNEIEFEFEGVDEDE